MRQYGCISPKFWVGKTGRALRGNQDAQLVALYLMSCPSAEMYGVFYCSLSSIIHEIGFDVSPSDGASMGLRRVKQALSMLQKEDFLFYDYESEYVFIKEFAKWQVAERLSGGDKRVISARNATESMPEPLRSMFIERYNEPFNLGLEASPNEGASMPHRSQEQEQEQDINICQQKNEPNGSDEFVLENEKKASKEKSFEENDFPRIVEIYNRVTKGVFPSLRIASAERATKARKFAKTLYKTNACKDKEDFFLQTEKYFKSACRVAFLRGENNRNWKAGFDYLISPKCVASIIEGTYTQDAPNGFKKAEVHDWQKERDEYFAKQKAQSQGLTTANNKPIEVNQHFEPLNHAEALKQVLGAKQ